MTDKQHFFLFFRKHTHHTQAHVSSADWQHIITIHWLSHTHTRTHTNPAHTLHHCTFPSSLPPSPVFFSCHFVDKREQDKQTQAQATPYLLDRTRACLSDLCPVEPRPQMRTTLMMMFVRLPVHHFFVLLVYFVWIVNPFVCWRTYFPPPAPSLTKLHQLKPNFHFRVVCFELFRRWIFARTATMQPRAVPMASPSVSLLSQSRTRL